MMTFKASGAPPVSINEKRSDARNSSRAASARRWVRPSSPLSKAQPQFVEHSLRREGSDRKRSNHSGTTIGEQQSTLSCSELRTFTTCPQWVESSLPEVASNQQINPVGVNAFFLVYIDHQGSAAVIVYEPEAIWVETVDPVDGL